jgi:hypothetical protein
VALVLWWLVLTSQSNWAEFMEARVDVPIRACGVLSLRFVSTSQSDRPELREFRLMPQSNLLFLCVGVVFDVVRQVLIFQSNRPVLFVYRLLSLSLFFFLI